jgi:antitoxin component of MazEF toxin-antitoxin module
MQIRVRSPQKVRKVGNSLVVTIPADFAAQHNIKADDLVGIAIEPLAVLPRLRPELARHAERIFSEHHDALVYLKEH